MKIELTKLEIENIIKMMEASSVPIAQAEPALKLYNKFKKVIMPRYLMNL